VAINKMDKPAAEPERVKRELTELGLQPEDWGGETLYALVSAKTGQGIDDLLETIRLQAEVLELGADPLKPAVGRVVEAQIDRGRGTVATVLVQGGTLKVGDAFVVGAHYGKVRALFNDRGQPVDSAGPSIPVQVQGISGVPEAGDELIAVEDEKVARQISDHRQAKRRETELSQTTRVSLENFLEQAQGEVKDLNIVIKADVQGSLEALRGALEKLSTDKVKLNVIHTGAGAITESDVMLASASQAIIIGFNVRANPKVHEVIEAEKVEVRYYDVIYKAIEEVREAMAGLLDSIFKEHSLGRAEVRLVYKISGVGTIAGSYIVDGLIRRGAKARLLRDGVVVYDGKIGSLKRFKDDAREVSSGYECGIGLENFNDLKVGDIIEAYELEEIRPELES
jgi:translation initiation factor IF-2